MQFLFFKLSWKFIGNKLGWWRHKNDHSSKVNPHQKNNWIYFFFKMKKKNSNILKFTWKIWNRLNRKKNQISCLCEFYFSCSGNFLLKMIPIFDEFSRITRKIKSKNQFISFFILFSTFHIFHKNLTSSWGRGEGLHILNWDEALKSMWKQFSGV